MATKVCAICAALLMVFMPATGWASPTAGEVLDFTGHWAGITAVVIFVLAYVLVIAEESIHLRKSKPVMVAAGIIWAIVALAYASQGDTHTAGAAVRHNLLEFGELFLFLLAAMTYINAMDERGGVRCAAGVARVSRIFFTRNFLGYRSAGILHITDCRQSHHRPAHGHSSHGGGSRSYKVHHRRLYQHRGGGQCRWRIQSLR